MNKKAALITFGIVLSVVTVLAIYPLLLGILVLSFIIAWFICVPLYLIFLVYKLICLEIPSETYSLQWDNENKRVVTSLKENNAKI